MTTGGTGALDTELRRNGFASTPLAVPMYGFAIDVDFHRVRFGIDVSNGTHDTLRRGRDGATATAQRTLGSFDVGYDVFVSRWFTVYPLVGFSFGGVDLQFDATKAPLVPLVFAKYAAKGRVDASSSAFATNLGVGFSTFFPFWDPHHPRKIVGTPGITLDVRVGYLVGVGHEDWRANDDAAPGLPAVPMEGPYGRLALGATFADVKYRPCSELCDGAPHAAPSCGESTCGLTCDFGYGECDGNLDDGCERALNTLDDCGGCGVRCDVTHGAGTCAAARCEVAKCDAGFLDCDGEPKNGCETSVLGLPGGVCPPHAKKK
ncbi:MAG TPA: hypothetical protein VH062_03005 [Polyangiaceae bacterium]|nr:hypothetical protein [Polyangiaceae bacterium]